MIISFFRVAEFNLYKWLRANTLDKVFTSSIPELPSVDAQGGWKERREAEEALQKYLGDVPSKHINICVHA